MSTNGWCIVALPEEGHPVHKVSSEKSAHLTILFLGDQREPALAIRIIEAVQHTIATSFDRKFSLGVQKRGTLGQDEADVLFFYKDETGHVKEFRSLLLKNDDIKKAYDSVEQFPEWTPHLTLGYPNAPAHPIPEDNHSISWITFDRIAVWLEDSDGPEFELGSSRPGLSEPEEVYHRDQMIQKGMAAMASTDDFLAHYGVKGMKWGVRKSESSSGSGTRARYREVRNTKPQTLELKGKNGETISVRENQKPLISALAAAAHPKLHENIMNSSSFGLYADGNKVGDADYIFQGKNREELYLNMIQVHPTQRGKGYASTVLDAAVEMGRKEGAKKITLDVPDNAPDAKHIYKKLGFKEAGAKITGDGIDAMWGGGLTPMALDISTDRIKHADPDYNEVDDEELEKAFEQHFQKLYAPAPKPKEGGEVEHVNADAFLAHYGVKGMKWGVRGGAAKAPSARSVAKTEKKAAKVQGKSVRKAERQKIADNLAKEFTLNTAAGRKRTGLTAASAILVGPATNMYLGAKITQASGYGKGESAVVGILGGAAGGIAVAEITARSAARKKS